MPDLTRTLSSGDGSSISSTALVPAGVASDTTPRPRNRRAGVNANPTTERSAAHSRASPVISPAPSRGISPMPSARLGTSRLVNSGRASPVDSSFSRGLLEGSWTPSWTSVQGFASSLLSGGESEYNSESSRPNSRNGSRSRPKSTVWTTLGGGASSKSRKLPDSWGPEPPENSTRPKAADIAAGSLAEREAALKAMKTASVLESYDGVNGGLDVAGKYKRRNSDEIPSQAVHEPVVEEQLVYLHHVQPNDTYAGVVLRYRCQEQAFRKTNGLWSRDNIQVRKHLMIPVDACETKGRPCDPPNFYTQKVDHLAATPQPDHSYLGRPETASTNDHIHDDFFSSRNGKGMSPSQEDQPWTHVRWVKIDTSEHPVEIVRVSKNTMGYFPPRRKKSIHTVSTFSTPRQSLDLSRDSNTGTSGAAPDQPGSSSTRRPSSLGSRPPAGSLGNSPSVTRSRGSSISQNDNVPAWMRRPGGVGTMSRSVRAPGPPKDYFNTWVNKRLPKGFNIDKMPSMSVMGSESAQWGFANKTDDDARTGIVESPFEDGRDADLVNNKQGIGLEQAAATIETWLRGAWAKRPSTPRLGASRRPTEDLDLIELTDTNSDDGRPRTPLRIPEPNLLNSGYFGSTGRIDGDAVLRGRSAAPKGKKAD